MGTGKKRKESHILQDEEREKKADRAEIAKRKKKAKIESAANDDNDSQMSWWMENKVTMLRTDNLKYSINNVEGGIPNKNITGNHPSFRKIYQILLPDEFWEELCNQVNDHLQKDYGKSNKIYQARYYDVKVSFYL
jgi:hypothetical protein